MLKRTTCRRCGREIYTIDSTATRAPKTYKKWGRICQLCMSSIEHIQMTRMYDTEIGVRN